jgi:SAM-dependent methyltransferase
MTENPSAYDWSKTRGEKWLSVLDCMQGTIAPIDEPLVRSLRLDAPLRVAEIGCGGGATTRTIRAHAPEGSVVHGFDISPALIEAARKTVAPDDPGIRFQVADMATAAPEQPYDRLVSRFGIMFFDDPASAFENLFRWLTPEGRFAFAVWGPVEENPWFTSVRDEAAKHVELPVAPPDAPGPFRYADAGKLHALLSRAGFVDLDVRDWRGTLPLGGGLSAEQGASFALGAFAGFGELLTKAGDHALEEATRSHALRFSQHLVDGVVRLDARVHVLTGAR